jgi:hypothetical protein
MISNQRFMASMSDRPDDWSTHRWIAFRLDHAVDTIFPEGANNPAMSSINERHRVGRYKSDVRGNEFFMFGAAGERWFMHPFSAALATPCLDKPV